MSYTDQVFLGITGRLAMAKEEASVLEWCLLGRPGIHVEIGVLWGGTLALAAMAKGRNGTVIGIDPMATGYWVDRDPVVKMKPTLDAVYDNLAHFGVKAHIIQKPSNPFPTMELELTTALIDGDHSEEACLADWQNLYPITSDLIFIHDYDSERHSGVTKAARQITQTPGWRVVGQVSTLLIMGRY